MANDDQKPNQSVTRRDFIKSGDDGDAGRRRRVAGQRPRRVGRRQRRDPHRPHRLRRPRHRRGAERAAGRPRASSSSRWATLFDGSARRRSRKHARDEDRRQRSTSERPRVHRLRRLQEGDRQRRQLRHPGDAARLPPDASQGGGRGRQAHLHREAGRGRRAGHPHGASPRTRRRRRRSSAIGCRHCSAATRPATSRR